jgi:hypothetical protein
VTRKDVRNPLASLVFIPVHPVALGTSPDFATLAEPRRRAEC